MYLLRNLDLEEFVQQNSNHNLLGLAVICAKTENSTEHVQSNTSANYIKGERYILFVSRCTCLVDL